ncbi:MAG: hydroxyethylthiazole kinase [Neisseriaceae bacterium]
MLLNSIRHFNPIVLCVTNPVSANFQADGLLAIGASPLMSEAQEELEEVVSKVQAVSLNLGTVNASSLALMLTAGQAANRFDIPVLLDPVGVGFTQYRLESARFLLREIRVQAIRCNQGELAALAGIPWQAQGVDSGRGEVTRIKGAVQEFARQQQCLVAVTGREDILASGDEVALILGGTPLTTQVTASGCLLSSLGAAALSLSTHKPFEALRELLQTYKECACLAEAKHSQPAAFKVALLDQLHQHSQQKGDFS